MASDMQPIPGHILLVEDDADIRSVFREVLAAEGYSVTELESGFGVLGLVKRLRPTVILLDVGLPFRSGGAVLSELKADPTTAAIPIVVVSGYPDSLSPERRCMAAGVVEKPVGPKELVRAVQQACQGRSATRSQPSPQTQPSGD